jgi:hypothetical protein
LPCGCTGTVVPIVFGGGWEATDDVADGEGEALLLGEELPADADGAAGDEEDFTAFLDEGADLCEGEGVWE